LWMAEAIVTLPVPDPPRIKAMASVRAKSRPVPEYRSKPL
jgi:hypothetical protein